MRPRVRVERGGHRWRRAISGVLDSRGIVTRSGHSLVEIVVVVLILSALTWVAVPRLPFGAVTGAQAEGSAARIATALRRARARAIFHAMENPDGFALHVTGSGRECGYQLVDLNDAHVVATHAFPPAVRCTGGRTFEFGPLGNLKEGSDTRLHVSSGKRTLTIVVTPATGRVICR